MLKLADIAVYSPDNRLQLTVEVKSNNKCSSRLGGRNAQEFIRSFGSPALTIFPLGAD